MSEELKPCPFCGGSADTIIIDSESAYDDDCRVECHDCGAKSGTYGLIEFAIEAWNQRAGRTCTAHQECLSEHMENCIVRFSCGHMIFGLADEYHYCPNCGAKVIVDD